VPLRQSQQALAVKQKLEAPRKVPTDPY